MCELPEFNSLFVFIILVEHVLFRGTINKRQGRGDGTWLANSGGPYETDECDVRGSAGLQGDGVHTEVLQHVEDGLEPEVLHTALSVLVQGQTQVLQRGQQVKLKVYQYIFVDYIKLEEIKLCRSFCQQLLQSEFLLLFYITVN